MFCARCGYSVVTFDCVVGRVGVDVDVDVDASGRRDSRETRLSRMIRHGRG